MGTGGTGYVLNSRVVSVLYHIIFHLHSSWPRPTYARTRTQIMASTTSQAQEKRPVCVDDDSDVDDLDGAEIQCLQS